MQLDELMHERFKLLLQSNTGLTAALSYSRSRPPINLLPLFDSLDDSQAAALMRGGSSKASWGPKVSQHSTGGIDGSGLPQHTPQIRTGCAASLHTM